MKQPSTLLWQRSGWPQGAAHPLTGFADGCCRAFLPQGQPWVHPHSWGWEAGAQAAMAGHRVWSLRVPSEPQSAATASAGGAQPSLDRAETPPKRRCQCAGSRAGGRIRQARRPAAIVVHARKAALWTEQFPHLRMLGSQQVPRASSCPPSSAVGQLGAAWGLFPVPCGASCCTVVPLSAAHLRSAVVAPSRERW